MFPLLLVLLLFLICFRYNRVEKFAGGRGADAERESRALSPLPKGGVPPPFKDESAPPGIFNIVKKLVNSGNKLNKKIKNIETYYLREINKIKKDMVII